LTGKILTATSPSNFFNRKKGTRNLCSAVMASQPSNCPATQASPPKETHIVALIRVLPHQRVALGDPQHSELVVVLDSEVMANEEGKGVEKFLHSDGFVWLGQDQAAYAFENSGDKEARIILFRLNSQGAADTASSSST
jgi:hypothetical protein